MDEVGIRALKRNASAVVSVVAAGESVTITDRGRPVAVLAPLPADHLGRLRLAGRVRGPKRSLSELPVPLAGPGLSPTLTAMRDDEPY